MAGRDAFSRSAMLTLYRSVLKLHRRVLPQVVAPPALFPARARGMRFEP